MTFDISGHQTLKNVKESEGNRESDGPFDPVHADALEETINTLLLEQVAHGKKHGRFSPECSVRFLHS